MKIFINRKPVVGPWGGGNKTLSALCEKLISLNHNVVFDLEENLDLIFCFDPRPDNKGIWYQHFINYKNRNPQAKILQRVGDVGSHSKPELTSLVKQTTNISDYIIFTSQWAKDYINFEKSNYSIIANAPLSLFYGTQKNKNIQIKGDQEKIKIVTHHWSDNPKKGFDVYSSLSRSLGSNDKLKNKYSFTYIGRYNSKFSDENIKIVNPLSGYKLVEELNRHDIYLTASLEEAGANHVLEAMAIGLPVLYRLGGGSINEYCKDYYSKEYSDTDDLIATLERDAIEFNNSNVIYKRCIDSVVEEYVRIIYDQFS